MEEASRLAQEKSEETRRKMESITSSNTQLQDQLEVSREQCVELQNQLQKREVAMATVTGKLDVLTAELQTKVTNLPYYL